MNFADDMFKKFNGVVATLAINLRTKSEKTALTLEEYVDTLRASGVADSVIRQNLTQDLNDGGRIFGEFFKGIGVDVAGRLGELSRAASDLTFGFKPGDLITWISVSIQEGEKVCPDCEPRHGQVDTYGNWVLLGLPKTGWSVCRTNCKCILLSKSDVEGEASLTSPIQVGKN